MARRGRPPLPRAVLALHGSKDVKYIREPAPAGPDQGTPERPPWLSRHKDAVAAWDHAVPILSRIPGLLSHLDLDVLTAYCIALAQWRVCGDWIAEHGMLETRTIRNKAGDAIGEEVSEHPLASRQLKLFDKIMALSVKLGMSPADRASLTRSSRVPAKDVPKDKHAEIVASLFGSA